MTAVFSGPFQLQHWHAEQEILLTKNPICSYSDSVHLDGIHFKVIFDAKKAFASFERDELDWIGEPISPLPSNYLPVLLREKKIKPIQGLVGCWFNTSLFPFHNVHLRKAFALAIPRELLLDRLLLPKTLSARRIFPSILQGSEGIPVVQECQRAASALFQAAQEELKMKRLKVILTYETTDELSRLAVLLKGYWEELFPISIKLEPLPFKEFWQRLPKQQFQMGLFCSISQYTDSINFLERFEFGNTPRNFSGWENDKYQDILKRYRKTANYEKRLALSKKAEAFLLKEMPVAPLYQYQYTYLQKKHVRNLYFSPVGDIHFDRVYLEKRQFSVLQETDSLLEDATVFCAESC